MIRATSNVLFWPILPLFHAFCFEIIEKLICRNARLREKYLNRRAEFLEQYTACLFRERFPDATYFTGSKWENPATNEKGENDLLLIFDSIALVVEEKSGAINPIARRGGESIKQEIQQLMTEAAEQAHGFANLLHSQLGPHVFPTGPGTINKVDASNVKQFFLLGITLERFGPLATQLPKLQAAGLAGQDVKPVPTMSVADFEIALKLFETPFELLHYLTRRAAFELKRTFVGDELDLLAFYLQTGFAHKALPDPKSALVLIDLGRQLDPFLMDRTGGNRFQRPQRSLSKWWRQLLQALEKRNVHRRYELGCILLDMPDDEQHAFEKQFRKLCLKVKRRKNRAATGVEGIWNAVKSEVSNAVVAAAPVTTVVYPDRNFVIDSFADRAMTESGADQAVIILVDVELKHWPYSGIYLLDKS